MEGAFYNQSTFWTPEMAMALDADVQALEFGYSTLPLIPQVHHQDPILGIDAMVQNFYEGPKKCDCCPNWVEKPPTQMPEAARERYDHASVRVYKRKDHGSGSGTVGGLVATTDDIVEIQSRFTIDLIRPVLAEVGRLAPEKDKIKFEAPFRDLYFAHLKIMQLAQKYDVGSEEQKHLNVLIDVMNGLFATTSAEVSDLLSRRSISFKYIWALFPKDMIVYSKEDEVDRLYQVSAIEYHPPFEAKLKDNQRAEPAKGGYWIIHCCYFDFDGRNFGTRVKSFYERSFEGVRRIRTLKAYPIGYHGDLNLEKALIERGRKVLDLQDMYHCEHDAVADAAYPIDDDDDDDDDIPRRSSYHITGRVIVDAFALSRFNNDYHSWNQPLGDSRYDDEAGSSNSGATHTVSERSKKKLPRISDDIRRPNAEEQRLNREFLSENDQYLRIMKPTVPAYSLVTNKWYYLRVDNLKPILWSPEAFDNLVFPEQHKDLLLTFVEQHAKSSKQNDDLIPGKGQGLAILLSGPPGTGKTLTAEAISERLKSPLYRLQAENLGSTAKKIGSNPREAFELALYWEAIILLDEADSLLSKRSLENPDRNEIVSVVLRQLEYYQGVVFMTTNLLSNIDDAFRSRIRLHLCYPPLSVEYRLNLWKKFIERLDSSSTAVRMSEQDWRKAAQWELNGREIKNAAKNLYLWCQYKRILITLDRVESAIHVTAPFSKKQGEEVLDDAETQLSRKRARISS